MNNSLDKIMGKRLTNFLPKSLVGIKKSCNFALAFENDTTAEAERGAKERLKGRADFKKINQKFFSKNLVV